MINSIQSYQNTPKSSTNKAKANNSPNFGLLLTFHTEKAVGKTMAELGVAARQAKKPSKLITAISEWKRVSREALSKIYPDANVKATIKAIESAKGEEPKLRIELDVNHKGIRVLPLGDLIYSAKSNQAGDLVISHEPFTTLCEETVRSIDKSIPDISAEELRRAYPRDCCTYSPTGRLLD